MQSYTPSSHVQGIFWVYDLNFGLPYHSACSKPGILRATQGVPYHYSESHSRIVWTNIYFHEAELLALCHGCCQAWNYNRKHDGKVLLGYQVILQSIWGLFFIHISCNLCQNICYPLWNNRSYLDPSNVTWLTRENYPWVGPKSIRRWPGNGLAPRHSSCRHWALSLACTWEWQNS